MKVGRKSRTERGGA